MSTTYETKTPTELTYADLGRHVVLRTHKGLPDVGLHSRSGSLARIEFRRFWRDVPGTGRKTWNVGVFVSLEGTPDQWIHLNAGPVEFVDSQG